MGWTVSWYPPAVQQQGAQHGSLAAGPGASQVTVAPGTPTEDAQRDVLDCVAAEGAAGLLDLTVVTGLPPQELVQRVLRARAQGSGENRGNTDAEMIVLLD